MKKDNVAMGHAVQLKEGTGTNEVAYDGCRGVSIEIGFNKNANPPTLDEFIDIVVESIRKYNRIINDVFFEESEA